MTDIDQQTRTPNEIIHDQPVRGPFGEHDSLIRRECSAVARVVVGMQSDCTSTECAIVSVLAQSSDGQDQMKDIDQPIYGVCGQISGALSWKSIWHLIALNQLQEVTIGDKVREVCDRCFFNCRSIRRIIFGSSSSLERIGAEAFAGDPGDACQLEEISIPDGVRELCDRCFFNCCRLRRITFGPLSLLERIGVEAFSGDYVEFTCGLEEMFFGMPSDIDTGYRAVIDNANNACDIAEIRIPDGVRELCDRCFYNCVSLHRVTFGGSSSLERIGVEAFSGQVAQTVCQIEEVNIPDGVRELCDQCFYGCHNLQRVTFGPASSLERIGIEAFSGASAENACHIAEISIPDGVRELCDCAFCNCTSLARVTFRPSSSLERIGSECFGQSGLEQFEMPKSVSFVGGGAFGECPASGHFVCSDDCHFSVVNGLVLDRSLMTCYCSAGALSSILIPDHVHSLHDRCFYGCHSLQRVTFSPSSSLELIGAGAFSGDTDNACQIAEIHIPDGVRELGDRCFYNCLRLHRITFGPFSSLERIGRLAFTGMTYDDIDNPCSFACQLEEINIPDGVRELGDMCFYNCEKLSRITFGSSSSLERIGALAFAGDIQQYYDVSQYSLACKIEEIHIPDGVYDIGDCCFENCWHLRRITFGRLSLLERIGKSVFSGDSEGCNIEEISIPDGVCELCDGTFYNCRSLRHITFGAISSLEHIGERAFSGYITFDDYHCPGRACGCEITEISIPDRVRELCDGCFHGCQNLHTVTFGPSSSLERIGSQCFASTKLAHFEMPKSVSFVGGAAFGGEQFRECISSENFRCSDDCHITIIDGLVLDRSLMSCYCSIGALSSIFVPDHVRYLHDRCFYDCWSLQQVTFGPSSSLERIGVGAFSGDNLGCPIEEISIPDGVRELGDGAFYSCTKLCRITFGARSSLERIGDGAFSGRFGEYFTDDSPQHFETCAIAEISIPDRLRELGNSCFYGCYNLQNVTFGPSSSLERIGFQCFHDTPLAKSKE